MLKVKAALGRGEAGGGGGGEDCGDVTAVSGGGVGEACAAPP